MDLIIFLLQINVDIGLEKDLNGAALFNEILYFREIFPISSQPLNTLKYTIINELVSSFSKFSIALRVFVNMPVIVTSGERTFSKLKLIKNYLRLSTSSERLTNIALLSTKKDVCENLNLMKIIDNFS